MNINQHNIEFDRFGDGAPMLLVHGLGGTSNFWRPVINAFENDYTIVAPDLPSAGRSDVQSDVSIESLAEDMLALMSALEFEKFHLVGHSMGTIVCQHMAVMAPERIHDLVLLGPLAAPPDPAREALRARAEKARSEGMVDIANIIADVALAKDIKQQHSNVQGFVREMVLRQPQQGYAASCDALAAAQPTNLNMIHCRSLLITGDEDGVAPEANVRVLTDQLANADMRLLSQCGHWTLTERPDEVIDAMHQFLN